LHSKQIAGSIPVFIYIKGDFMSFRKVILLSFITLFIGVTVLYAQSNANLKAGVYRYSGIQGSARLVLGNTSSLSTKNVVIRNIDGDVAARGTARISGTRVNVDYGNQGFETWTIIDDETFTDDNYGNTWRWVRNSTKEDL
jgi:hypothetical protein